MPDFLAEVDVYGRTTYVPAIDTQGMLSPVKCRFCGKVYDLCGVSKIIARYADATVFMTPCCDKQADDRELGSSSSFRRL